MIKVITKLSTFEGRSAFRTWLSRIAINHVMNMKRTRLEEMEWTFDRYGSGLRSAPDTDLPDQNTVPVDLQLLVEEAKIGCTTGMLLCLSREQRLVYALGDIFGISDTVGAELLSGRYVRSRAEARGLPTIGPTYSGLRSRQHAGARATDANGRSASISRNPS